MGKKLKEQSAVTSKTQHRHRRGRGDIEKHNWKKPDESDHYIMPTFSQKAPVQGVWGRKKKKKRNV